MATIPNEFVELQLGTTANNTTTYSAIQQLVSLKPPGIQRADVKQTKKGDTSQRYRPGGQPEFGEVEFSVQYDYSIHSAIDNLAVEFTNAVRPFKVVHKNAANSAVANAAFNAYVKTFEADSAEDESDYIKSGTLKIDGPVTWS
jgi:hypothetical protein